MEGQTYDLIIVGAGPAGVTAAIYAKRALLRFLLLDQTGFCGGQVRNTAEVGNYPGLPNETGMRLADAFAAHAKALDIDVLQKQVTALKPGLRHAVVCGEETYCARAVLICTGASHRTLGIPGEEAYTGRGVSYCATCDGPLFRNRTVCVVGGGNTAVEDALYLSKQCRQVELIHRRDKLRAVGALQQRLFDTPNVRIHWNTVPVRIEGNGSRVREVVLRSTQSGAETVLPADGVFVAVGITPNSAPFAGVLDTKDGGILTRDGYQTSEHGVFAAGDVRCGATRQIVSAAGDGAAVLAHILSYLGD